MYNWIISKTKNAFQVPVDKRGLDQAEEFDVPVVDDAATVDEFLILATGEEKRNKKEEDSENDSSEDQGSNDKGGKVSNENDGEIEDGTGGDGADMSNLDGSMSTCEGETITRTIYLLYRPCHKLLCIYFCIHNQVLLLLVLYRDSHLCYEA